MNLFCHDQVQGWGWFKALAFLTLTWRQILRSVFPLGGCCRGAGASTVSHFHHGNHTHFPTELLRKMLQQSYELPRSCSFCRAPLSTLLTRRGRRPGRLLSSDTQISNLFRFLKTFAKFMGFNFLWLSLDCKQQGRVNDRQRYDFRSAEQKQNIPGRCTLNNISSFGLLQFLTYFFCKYLKLR